MGFSCQDLTRVDVADNPDMETETDKMSEADLVGKILRAFLLILCQLTQSSSDILESLSAYFPSSTYDIDMKMAAELSHESFDDLEEDIWGVAGIVIGLASSISAIYRAGTNDAVLKIKSLIMSWVPHVNSLVQCSGSCLEGSQMILSVGSCLALPVLVAFCLRVELIDANEIDHLLNGYRMLISELVSVKKSGIFHQSLLMASCIGAGSLLACVLNDGVHSIEVESIKVMLDLFRNCYCNPYPPLIHLGGMLGVVNAMGVDAGGLVHMHAPTTTPHSNYKQKVYFAVPAELVSFFCYLFFLFKPRKG